MNKFKKMKAIFEVVETNNKAFKKGNRFVVKRFESGAFAYGDGSAHSIDCEETQTHLYFDTRYDGISTHAKIWRNYWQKCIESVYGVKLRYIVITNN